MRLRSLVLWLVAVFLVVATAAGFLIVRRGFSARDEPSWAETFVARRIRTLAVPARARNAENPLSPTPEVLAAARGHFADHCATCHANDGSGQTTLGQNLYPKAPDMRLDDTQRLTDGELYYVIQNGIRMTGMPAWGEQGNEKDEDGWGLVHLIRRLSELTPAQLKEMEKLNPKTAHELEEERLDEEFLRSGSEPAEPAPASPGAPSQPHRH